MKNIDNTNKIMFTALVISIFSLGFISAYLVLILDDRIETPFTQNSKTEPPAPTNFITEDNIRIYDDRIVIYIDNPRLSRYAPTGSMLPTLNEFSNGIKVTPESSDEIKVGDIITFRSGTDLIVHRVIEKGYDSEGVYFITKGDNNIVSDGKIRFDMIDSKTVAILY